MSTDFSRIFAAARLRMARNDTVVRFVPRAAISFHKLGTGCGSALLHKRYPPNMG